jgi:hypothetical protein
MPQFWLRLKNNSALLLVAILILAAGLRLYRINEIPYGFYWDEAAITYNAWGISVWNRDEFGNKLPVSFKSFGDYKAPLLIYLLGGIYKFTGLHPEYLRIIIAFSGIGVVVITFLLTQEFERQKKLPHNTALVSAFFMAITPWGVNFSRFGLEAMLALLLFTTGVLFLEKSKTNSQYFYLAGILFSLCLYAYHSAKIVTPIFLLMWASLDRQTIWKQKKAVTLSLALSALVLTPLIQDTLFGPGFERGKSLIFFSNPALLPQNIASFLSLNYWIFGQDSVGLRHNVPGFGVLPKTIFIFLIIGLVQLLKKKKNRRLVIWAIIGLLPSMLSNDAPHAIRSLMALPPVIMIASWGYMALPKVIQKISIIILLVETVLYLNAYYGTYAIQSATAFQYGYKQAILTAEKIADPNDKIIVTDYYGQPYIYTLLYRKLTPEEFKFGALANYEFRKISWPDTQENRVYVATPEEISPNDPSVIQTLYIPQTNQPVFVITTPSSASQ